MEIIGVPWMIVLIMPPTIIIFHIGFTFFDEIEATSRYSYLKWAIRFLCSVGVGNNLWGLVSWFVRSGLLSITNLKLRDRMGFWFVVFEEIFGRTGRKERVAIRDELSI